MAERLLAFRMGMTLAWQRAGEAAQRWLYALMALVVLVTAVVERSSGTGVAANRTLYVAVALVMPLGLFASARLFTGKRRLGESVWSVARYGGSRRAAALGLVVGAGVLAAVAVVLFVGLALGIVYAGRPGFLVDLLTSTWIVALGSFCYMCWFLVLGSWGVGGRGRWVPLALDFTLGTGSGVVAALWPRALLAHLLGHGAILEFSQRQSSALLFVSSCALLVALWSYLRD